MRKTSVFLFCIVVIFCFLFIACESYGGFKEIDIKCYGTIKVPENWLMTTSDDGYVYFGVEQDGIVKTVLIQYFDENNTNENKDFDKVEELSWLESEGFSNSAGIRKYNVNYNDGSYVERYAVYLTGGEELSVTEFLCVDNTISVDLLKKIANSYKCTNTG